MAENTTPPPRSPKKLGPVWRALIEVSFIIFLYYSNLLMGEYEGSAPGMSRRLGWALRDIVTGPNLAIALSTALVGYLVIELLRKRF
jgi:hypothetical protein